jgi:hypothetical protein
MANKKDEENETVTAEKEDRRTFKTQPLRQINEIINDLHKPIHPRHLRTRRQGGKELTYIAWYDAAKYLDLYAPGWCHEIRSVQQIAGKVVITVRLTIPTSEGIIYREATGHEDEDTDSYGDAFSNSESMALRRCAAKFGLGQHLYREK